MVLPVIINYALYGIVAICTFIGLWFGFSRGFKRATVRFLFIALSFGLSFALFSAIYPWLYSLVDGKTLADVAATYGINLDENLTRIMSCIEGDTVVYVSAIPLAIAVLPVGFLVVFLLVTLALTFLYITVCGALGFGSKYNTPLTRILGGAVGAIQGALIALLILMPVDGIVDVATVAITHAEQEHPDSANAVAIGNVYHQNLDGVVTNPVLKFSDDCFGFVYDRFATLKVEGEDASIIDIADDMFELFVLYGDLGADFNYKLLTEEDKIIIDKMLDCFCHDRLMAAIAAGGLSAVGKASQNGALVIQTGEPMLSLLMAFLDICSTWDINTVEGDLKTLSQVYYLFSDEGLLLADGVNSMFASFLTLDENGSSTFKRMTAILDQNPRFIVMSNTCSKVAMDLLLQNSGFNNSNVAEKVESVKDGINSVVGLDKNDYATEEEYKADVNKGITETLTENGISMSEEKIDELTDFVIGNYGDKTEISDDEFLDFMSKYYDTYAKGGSGLPDTDSGTEGDTEPDADSGIEGGTEPGTEGATGGGTEP